MILGNLSERLSKLISFNKDSWIYLAETFPVRNLKIARNATGEVAESVYERAPQVYV